MNALEQAREKVKDLNKKKKIVNQRIRRHDGNLTLEDKTELKKLNADIRATYKSVGYVKRNGVYQASAELKRLKADYNKELQRAKRERLKRYAEDIATGLESGVLTKKKYSELTLKNYSFEDVYFNKKTYDAKIKGFTTKKRAISLQIKRFVSASSQQRKEQFIKSWKKAFTKTYGSRYNELRDKIVLKLKKLDPYTLSSVVNVYLKEINLMYEDGNQTDIEKLYKPFLNLDFNKIEDEARFENEIALRRVKADLRDYKKKMNNLKGTFK